MTNEVRPNQRRTVLRAFGRIASEGVSVEDVKRRLSTSVLGVSTKQSSEILTKYLGVHREVLQELHHAELTRANECELVWQNGKFRRIASELVAVEDGK